MHSLACRFMPYCDKAVPMGGVGGGAIIWKPVVEVHLKS